MQTWEENEIYTYITGQTPLVSWFQKNYAWQYEKMQEEDCSKKHRVMELTTVNLMEEYGDNDLY